MSLITGTVKNGLVVLDEPTGLPDGSRVVVQPVETAETFGISESDWQDTPEAVTDWLMWYESLEPLKLSVDDEESLNAFRQCQKEESKLAFDDRADRLRKIWQ